MPKTVRCYWLIFPGQYSMCDWYYAKSRGLMVVCRINRREWEVPNFRLTKLLLLILLLVHGQIFAVSGTKFSFSIPTESLESALLLLSEQSGVAVISSLEKLAALKIEGIEGEFTLAEALELLLRGTDL